MFNVIGIGAGLFALFNFAQIAGLLHGAHMLNIGHGLLATIVFVLCYKD